ncbi:MAG: preprotein translocase subunit SecG [Clostridia bacterium]|nr:preprotein translocase subunit SecG [Clostridia bacterium]
MLLALEISLLVMGVALVVCVLAQSAKEKGLSGSIAGGAETFFGKTKGKTMDRILNKLTIVLASVFGILSLITYLIIA